MWSFLHESGPEPDYLEPITKYFPDFRVGGSSQSWTKSVTIVDEVIDLATGKVVWSRKLLKSLQYLTRLAISS